MIRLACQYAIIRFLPYAETGEFANVGVVLACPATGYLDARLMPTKKTGRITGFFEQLDTRIYREALKYLGDELTRVREMARDRVGRDGTTIVEQVFAGLTRPREAMLRFGDTRVVMTDDAEAMLGQLFARFVERDFANKQYHDRILERGVRQVLEKANLRELFKEAEIGNEYMHVHVPFAHLRDGEPVLAIKPLDLARVDPNQVFELGGRWVDRIRRLRKHDLLPGQILFAVNKPTPAEKNVRDAAEEIVGELREMQVEVVLATDAKAITEFAKAASVH